MKRATNVRRVTQILRELIRLYATTLRRRHFESRGEQAIRLRTTFERLGGAWIKLGQALALRFDLIPSEYCVELFQLFNRLDSFPFEQVRAVVRAELGGYPEQVFASFDPTPFAAASIGQVHRATLRSGENVAVKVQRPNVAEVISTDIELMYWLAWIVDRLHLFGGTRSRQVIDQFASWTEKELDYLVEARHAFNLARNAGEELSEKYARVYTQYTTRRVLTMEYIAGVPVIDIMYAIRRNDNQFLRILEVQGHDLQRIATHIAWTALNQIYAQGYFHADLHPANLFVLPNDQIAYVDFGIIGRLPFALRTSLMHFARNLIHGNLEQAADEFMRWATTTSNADEHGARVELIEVMDQYVFSLENAEVFSGQSASRGQGSYGFIDLQIDILEIIRRYRLSVSSEIVVYLKTVITVDAVIFELCPEFDLIHYEERFFRGLLRDFADDFLRPASLANHLHEYSQWAQRALAATEASKEYERATQRRATVVRRHLTIYGTIAIVAGFGLYAVAANPQWGAAGEVVGISPATVLVALLTLSVLMMTRQWSHLKSIDSGVTRRGPKSRFAKGRSAYRRPAQLFATRDRTASVPPGRSS
jgi:ubiquinone biosynthesis protein